MRDYIGEDPVKTLDITLDVTPKENGGFRATLRIPLDAGRALFVARSGETKEAAYTKAGKAGLGRILDRPELNALVPPQAKLALGLLTSPTARAAAEGVINKLKGWNPF